MRRWSIAALRRPLCPHRRPGHDVTLNIFADDPEELIASPEQIAAHKKLVDEALALYGARHFDHYDFLFAISNRLGGIGLEHHRSSENAIDPGYFKNWAEDPGDRNILPHEFSHSWDGKYRRPRPALDAGLCNADAGRPALGL